MNTLGNETAEFGGIKQKLLEWITLRKNLESEKSENINADVTELSIIAQLMGYKLESFQTWSHLKNIKEEVKIEITCLKSGVRSVLLKSGDMCSCPSDEALQNGQFWNVVGIGSSSSHFSPTSISNSESSLLPKLSNTTKLVIKGLLKKITGLIVKNPQDTEITVETTFIRHNSLKLVNRKKETKEIKRTNSFDITSNYKPNLCTSTPDTGLSNGKRFKCHISPRISNIKPAEGPAVKYIREIRGLKSEVNISKMVPASCERDTVEIAKCTWSGIEPATAT